MTTHASNRILIAGNIDEVFIDKHSAVTFPIERCENMIECIEQAAMQDYAAVAVVLSSNSEKLTSALKALRKATDAKIVILSMMYEEPLARQLTQPNENGERIADDYLICPATTEHLMDVAGVKPKEQIAPADETLQKTEQHIRKLEELATTDDLTGLKNRRYMYEFARQILEYAKTERGNVTLLIFDIDDFKHYNDEYGHAVGDDILREAADLIKRCCRTHDVVGRIGGDEFAVLFWDDPSVTRSEQENERRALSEHPSDAIIVAKRFVRELKDSNLRVIGYSGKGTLTISGGLASFPRDAGNVEKLFEKADTALLAAKRSGKNSIYLVGKAPNDINHVT